MLFVNLNFLVITFLTTNCQILFEVIHTPTSCTCDKYTTTDLTMFMLCSLSLKEHYENIFTCNSVHALFYSTKTCTTLTRKKINILFQKTLETLAWVEINIFF